VWQSID
jgi:hypothetical protein